MKEYINVKLIGDPCVDIRYVMPWDSEEEAEEKNIMPFLAHKSALIKVIYRDKKGKETQKIISNPTEYLYDGATIPFRIGKGNMKLLIPALYHDIICEDKSLVDYNRRLSSLIFKELLLQCRVNIYIAEFMYSAVDTYQRFMKGWKCA